MRRRNTLSLVLAIGLLTLSLPQEINCQEGQGAIYVAGDLSFTLELLSPISTATNHKGDKFTCKVIQPNEYAGALVGGHIASLKRSGKTKGKSEIDLAFDTITLPDGRTGNFSAVVKEVFDVKGVGNQGRADNEGTVRAKSTTKRDTAKVVGGTAIGAILGGIFGGKEGAIIGGTIGGGIGVTSTLATKGPDLEFKQGTQFTVLTNAPPRRRLGDAPARVSSQPMTSIIPSTRYRTYMGSNLFRVSVPDSWRDASYGDNSVTLAPDGGYVNYQGQSDLTHGTIVGVIRTQGRDLQQASDQYVGALLRGNTYLSQQGAYQRTYIARRNALSVILAGRSNVTGRIERVAVYTTLLRNGNLFYMVAVVPQEEYSAYQNTFQNILSSIQINDE